VTFVVQIGGWRCDAPCLVELGGDLCTAFAFVVLIWWGLKTWGEHIARKGDR
jgi:hypothetical protein